MSKDVLSQKLEVKSKNYNVKLKTFYFYLPAARLT